MNGFRYPFITLSVAAVLLAVSVLIRAADPTVAGHAERTVSALEADVKRDPSNSELWRHLGFAYRRAGQINDAQRAFEKVTSLNPKDHDVYSMLGLIYESKQMKPEAKRAWQQYLAGETNPDKRMIAEKHIHYLSQ